MWPTSGHTLCHTRYIAVYSDLQSGKRNILYLPYLFIVHKFNVITILRNVQFSDNLRHEYPNFMSKLLVIMIVVGT